jgi:GMP synthase (glutamine-hydrolysing)
MTVLIVNATEWGEEHAGQDYPKDVGEWFVDGIGDPRRDFTVWRVQREEAPAVTRPEAVYIGGSAASVYDPLEWIGRLSEAVRKWREQEVPVLGVCFGHQIVAHALGGRVEKNPMGWEVGSQEVELTDEGACDPLFRELPRRFPAMQSHQDIVVSLPPGARVLARNAMSEYQAFALGDRIRTVQFHPEYTAEHLRFLLTPRRERLTASGVDMDAVLGDLCPTPESRGLLKRFLDAFVNPQAARSR